MRLAAIQNETDYRSALDEIERLMIANPTIGSENGDRLEVLSVLVEEYETAKFPVELPSPIEAIKFRMEQMDLEQRDLIPYIGVLNTVAIPRLDLNMSGSINVFDLIPYIGNLNKTCSP